MKNCVLISPNLQDIVDGNTNNTSNNAILLNSYAQFGVTIYVRESVPDNRFMVFDSNGESTVYGIIEEDTDHTNPFGEEM
ncbi:MAG TPA: hypothetical protein VI911_11325 [Patescibacteria group bacterium]|nr:hypothetical protein [Patescibacteria group bacterium]